MSVVQWTFKRYGRYIGHVIEGANLEFLQTLAQGKVLNVCCGYDNSGDVLVDLDIEVLVNRQKVLSPRDYIHASLQQLPFSDSSFETVICDPPYSMYGKFLWILELFRVAKKRLILSTPTYDVRPPEGWLRELWFIGSNHMMIRLWWVFTKEAVLE